MLTMFGIGAFFLAGLLVAIRLLGLWRHTRQLPELTAALGLLGIGPLGFCILMTGYVMLRDTPLLPIFRATGLGLQALGFVATACFTWRVFRPGAKWAALLTVGFSLALLGTCVGMVVAPIQSGHLLLHHHVDTSLKILCLGWGALESLRYWWISQKRVTIGFADPLVSASFLMWGITLCGGALGFIVIYAAIVSLEPGEQLSSPIQIVLSSCGIVAALALYLSFLPPQAYRRRIEARARASGG